MTNYYRNETAWFGWLKQNYFRYADSASLGRIVLMLNTGEVPGGGGGVLRFGSDGGVPLKRQNCTGSFWRKRVPIIRGFYSRKWHFCVLLATKWAKISSIYSKITKLHPMFRDFSAKPYPMFRDFFAKKSPIQRHTPVYLIRRVPPPPPRGEVPCLLGIGPSISTGILVVVVGEKWLAVAPNGIQILYFQYRYYVCNDNTWNKLEILHFVVTILVVQKSGKFPFSATENRK